ncbi:MAG: phosphotransferase [Candidatus Omnitrophica bacterium]|nr:phosphotransferase [Candidatus Omnitrophota bacterium]
MKKDWLLCDFHIHTELSDGKLPLREIVDLFGNNRFDAICITDHVYDRATIKLWVDNNERPCTIHENGFRDYLELIRQEGLRAQEQYGMLVIPGIEISNNPALFHITAIDIKTYIDPDQDVEELIEQIHQQDALAVACHPHYKDSEPEMPFIHLWDNHERYANLFDAWEVANRDDLFNVVGLKRFNYIASSDFHEPHHVYSWKTLLKAEKNAGSIKSAIRQNKDIAIYLHRKAPAS